MYGTHITPHDAGADLDGIAARFLADDRVVRGFDVLDGNGFAAMIDSDTSDDGGVFAWIGRWPERPARSCPPPVEVAAAGTFDELARRRSYQPGGPVPAGAEPTLRSRSGEIVPMAHVTAPGFSRAWVGAVDGAVVGLFFRSDTRSDVIVAELDDLQPVVARWRALVDGFRASQ